MEIVVVAVGRVKGDKKYVLTGVDEYVKRMKPYVKITLIEVADETITPSRTEAQVMDREAERLSKYMDKAAYTVALSERGELLDSVAFAQALGQRLGLENGKGLETQNPPNGGMPDRGSGPMMFLVGGALGLSPAILNRADWVVSLSPLTFPHQLVRLILLEQLYRAFRILRGEPYHK